MTWKVQWHDIIFVPNAKTRGSMYSLIANKMRGSQLVNMKYSIFALYLYYDEIARNSYLPLLISI